MSASPTTKPTPPESESSLNPLLVAEPRYEPAGANLMHDREHILPLALGALAAVVLHVVLAPLAARAFSLGDGRVQDLRIVAVTAPSRAEAGDVIELSFTVNNAGQAAARFGWQDRVYLSDDESISADDRLVTTLSRTDPLPPGTSYQMTAPVRIPARMQGAKHLIVRTDVGRRSIADARDDSRTAAAPIEIVLPPRPDLVAKSLTMPEVIEVGRPFEVIMAIANAGDVGIGSGVWRDTL